MITQDDIRALREYVRAPGNNGQNQAESTVRLHVSHSNLRQEFMDLRLEKHMTIQAVKIKLHTHCGTLVNDMLLQLRDEDGNLMGVLEDHNKLGYYSPYDGCTLHIIDMNPSSVSANGWLEDTSKVDKYVISDAAYDERENTFRKFKQEKLKEDPEWTLEKEMAKRRGVPYEPPTKKATDDPEAQADEAAAISVGSRCEVAPGAKRGVVRYIGKCEGLPPGYWVGIEYDEPFGKNDGCVKGRRYFDCPMGYGAIVRPAAVVVGDFPPLDEFDDEDPDEI